MERSYDEPFWTNTTSAPAYQKSKTLAEKAAWEFITQKGGQLELSVVNPAAVMGPVLGPEYSHSIYLVKNLLSGKMPGCPKINACFVDVRDVADLHLRAMIDPKAKGQRFIATGGESIWLVEVARILKENLGASAGKVKVKQLPNLALRIAALKDPMVKSMIPLLGIPMDLTSARPIHQLGWSPRSPKAAILAAAESLIRVNLL
ncbi:nucleoside-diphosphate-sugar epimerase [Mucilaginibacter sp. OAE612]|uniref:hypothetical protein n=1 Tax=Mucilaginibacter sp. OAE612 TaxID=3156444 RepID=UPI00359D6092